MSCVLVPDPSFFFYICCWEMSDQEARRGRKRKPWAHVATEAFLETETLRKGAQRWLREKKIKHSTLTATTFEGVGAGWCTYVRGSAFWDFGGGWGRICGPPRDEIRQSAFWESIYLSIHLSIYLSRELGMVRPRQEFLNVSYLSISLSIYLSICLRLVTGSWEWWDPGRSSLM